MHRTGPVAAMLLTAAALPRFDFQAIEFAPADERLPAAQAFVASAAPPGTPLAQAIAAMESAKARCHAPSSGGAIVCDYARPLSRSAEEMPLGDVTWTVRIVPGPGAVVATASVERREAGN